MEFTLTNLILLAIMYLLVGMGLVAALIQAHSRYDLASPKVYLVGATIWPIILVLATIMTLIKIAGRNE